MRPHMRLLSSLFIVLIQVDSEGEKPRELVTDFVVGMLCPVVGVVVNLLLSFTKWSNLMVSPYNATSRMTREQSGSIRR